MTILDAKLQNSGVDELRYYYKNCSIIGNIYTVCVLISKDKKILARGISIRSIGDSHVKESGRRLSKSRAIQAFYQKSDSLKIGANAISKRDFIFATNSFKLKNETIESELTEKVENLGLDYQIKNLGNFKRLDVHIPYSITADITQREFKFKSCYLPEPTSEEKKMFNIQ